MTAICSHIWIDLADPPIARAPVAPVLGSRRHELKDGHTYACQRCGTQLTVDVQALLRRANPETGPISTTAPQAPCAQRPAERQLGQDDGGRSRASRPLFSTTKAESAGAAGLTSLLGTVAPAADGGVDPPRPLISDVERTIEDTQRGR